jgi:hypothetical protein
MTEKYNGILTKFSEKNDSHLSQLADLFEEKTGLYIIKEQIKVFNFWTTSGKYLIVNKDKEIVFKTNCSTTALETFLNTFELVLNNLKK